MPVEDVGVGALDSVSSGYTNYFGEFQTDGPESESSLNSINSYASSSSSEKVTNRLDETGVPGMGSTKYQLEDYIYEMECRQSGGGMGHRPPNNTDETQDVYTRLEQKENDLILAAELGKALLERNEILIGQNEKLAEDYSQKLEILEQEKHILRRKLVATEGDYDVKIQELSADLECVRHELSEKQEVLRQTDREKGQIIEELTEQNQRLSNQLKESSKREEQLNAQLKQLRDQFNLRRSNMSDQVCTLEMLKEEITFLTDKKMDLERRVDALMSEREGLSVTLDESSDRIVMLEKQSREKEQMLRNSQRDLEDLRHTNLSLTDRLEAVSRNSSASPSMGHTSLMNEIDMSDPDASRPHSHPSLPEDLLELEEDIEYDEPVLIPQSDAELLKQLRQEILDVTVQLRVLVEQMRHRRRNSLTSLSTNSSDELNASQVKAGALTSIVKDLQGLIREILRREAQGQCSACGRMGPEDKIQLEQEVHRALEALDKMNIELTDHKEKLKAKSEESERYQQEITLKEAQMKALQEERDNLKFDLNNTHLAKDELIKKAWDMRDAAVARKNACEIELARTRIDLMQVNSQLMEAVQQKIELSQQLEQWQVDMQQLLDDQMRKKLTRMEASTLGGATRPNQSDSDSSSSGKNSPKRNFRIFTLLASLRRTPTTNSAPAEEKS